MIYHAGCIAAPLMTNFCRARAATHDPSVLLYAYALRCHLQDDVQVDIDAWLQGLSFDEESVMRVASAIVELQADPGMGKDAALEQLCRLGAPLRHICIDASAMQAHAGQAELSNLLSLCCTCDQRLEARR